MGRAMTPVSRVSAHPTPPLPVRCALRTCGAVCREGRGGVCADAPPCKIHAAHLYAPFLSHREGRGVCMSWENARRTAHSYVPFRGLQRPLGLQSAGAAGFHRGGYRAGFRLKFLRNVSLRRRPSSSERAVLLLLLLLLLLLFLSCEIHDVDVCCS